MNKEDYKVYSDKMRKSIDAVNADFASVRAGRANASVLDRISVDYYGSPTPIQQIAAIASPDPRQLVITPWDGTALKPIERAIQESDLGINPQNDGKSIRLNFPQLTEERRKELVKQIHKYSETGKVAIRNIRRDAMEAFKKKQKASEITEDDLKTLDGILAAANAAGKKVHMDVSNGWYLASFFLGNGCTLTIEDGKQVIDFNNANGLAAAEAIRAFCNDPAFVTGDDSVLAGGIGDAIACGVSGTWVASAIQVKLGDNYGCCKLPTFTCDGKQVQMGSFLGCKIYGVNSQTAYPVDSMELAEYLTSEKAQIERYNVLNYGPSNVNALADDTIASNLALQALNIAIDDVMASDLVAVETHNLVLDQILNLLDRHGVARVLACLGDVLCRVNHLAVGKTRALLDLQVCGADGIDNLIDVKDNLGAAALDDLHPLASFASKSYCASEPNDARQGLPLSCGAVAQSVFSKTIGPHADNPRSQSRGSKIHPNGANKVLVLCPPSIIRQRRIYILYSFFRSNTTYSVSAGQSNWSFCRRIKNEGFSASR